IQRRFAQRVSIAFEAIRLARLLLGLSGGSRPNKNNGKESGGRDGHNSKFDVKLSHGLIKTHVSQSTTVLEVFDNLQPSTKIIAFEDRWDFVGHVDKARYQAVDRAAARCRKAQTGNVPK
ncbi:MAG: hypothetical protein WB610_19805, partial [Rhodomicrobium sp.]